MISPLGLFRQIQGKMFSHTENSELDTQSMYLRYKNSFGWPLVLLGMFGLTDWPVAIRRDKNACFFFFYIFLLILRKNELDFIIINLILLGASRFCIIEHMETHNSKQHRLLKYNGNWYLGPGKSHSKMVAEDHKGTKIFLAGNRCKWISFWWCWSTRGCDLWLFDK